MSVSVLKHVCLCSIWSSSPPKTWFWEAHHRNHFAGPRLICYHGRKGTSSWWPFYQYFSQLRAFWQNENCALVRCWPGWRNNHQVCIFLSSMQRSLVLGRPTWSELSFSIAKVAPRKIHATHEANGQMTINSMAKRMTINSMALYQNCTFWSG